MTPFTTTRRVEFGDTDMAGIVHFANFFHYMEAAETDFLRSRGLTVSWADGDSRLGFPRVSTSCDFRKPAKFEDVLSITVTVEKIGTKSLSYRFDFADEKGNPVAVGRVTSVFCRSGDHGRKFESIAIPADIRAKLET